MIKHILGDCVGSITNMRSLNVLINDFIYPAGE